MKAVHLAIDYQDWFLLKLSNSTACSFAAAGRTFADDLRKRNVPTIWVGCAWAGDNWRLLDVEDDPYLHRYFVSKHGFNHVRPKQNEAFFIKAHDDVFYPRATVSLAAILKDRGVDTLVISGMNTSMCITDTIRSALQRNFHVMAAYDQMADERRKTHHDRTNAGAQRSRLQETLAGERNTFRLRYATRAECLDHFPARTTPEEKPARRPLTDPYDCR